jgi:uncharacterized membrane protein
MLPAQLTQDPASNSSWKKLVVFFISMVGFALSLTLLFLSMRAVMDVGGFCAEGGAYEITTHCPKGIPLFANLSVFGMIFFAITAIVSISNDKEILGMLMWAALFISLGWNFFEYGLYPPNNEGIGVGWLITGSLFWLMGIGPLFAINFNDLKPNTKLRQIEQITILIAIAAGVYFGLWLFGLRV